jgi:hypothetical protein
MLFRRKFTGGLLVFIGFMLSPLSWWNDAFVNLPLAIGFGWLVSLVHKPAFEAGVVIGYWLTNVLGFVLMHRGVADLRSNEKKAEVKSELKKDLLISLGYTGLIIGLLQLKILKPLGDYLAR